MKCFFVAIWALVPLGAQTLSTPIAGTVLNGDGRLLAIPGVLGSLMPGRAIPILRNEQDQRALSAAFPAGSDQGNGGAVKTSGEILVIDGAGTVQAHRAAPPGSALFAPGIDGQVEWLYFPESQRLESVDGAVSVDASSWGDAVIALGAADQGSVAVLARKDAQLWSETVDIKTGAIRAQIPVSGAEPGLFFEGGWLVKRDHATLLWQSTEQGNEMREIPVQEDVTALQTAGPHAAAINSHWLLNGNWQVFEIPVVFRNHPRSSVSPPRGRAQ